MTVVVDRRLAVLFAVAILTGATVTFLVWHYLLTGLLLYAIYRWHRSRSGVPRRRRPRSSWAKLLEAGSLAAVAWNTRHLTAGRRPSKAFVLRLGRTLKRNEQTDDYGFPFEDTDPEPERKP